MTSADLKASAKPKRSSDEYINFRKKITDKNKIRVIEELKREWCLTEEEVCARLLFDAIAHHRKRLSL